jgi:hypothetical protein
LFLGSCNKEPLFDELNENRMLLFMKGTYSSNGPKPFSAYPASFTTNADCKDDSVLLPDAVGTIDLTLADLDSIRLDLAQIGVINTSRGDFEIDETKVKKLSDYRQLFTFKFQDNPVFTPGDIFNKFDLADPNLSENDKARAVGEAQQKNREFFNDDGYGLPLKNDDVGSGHYNKFRVFVRRMVTDKAKSFLLSGSSDVIANLDQVTTLYDNELVNGFEISQMYRFNENDINSSTENYLFPYSLTKDFYLPGKGPVHIEFRLFVKNRMKVFETRNISFTGSNFALTSPLTNSAVAVRFWAFSDFVTNFDSASQTMKDNFMLALHVYNPETVGSITGTVPAAYLTNDGDLNPDIFVAVVPSGSAIPENYIPEMATGSAVGGIYTVNNVPPGSYDVYLMQDIKSAGTGQETRRDGFPETLVMGLAPNPIIVYVPEKESVTADFQ